MNATLTAERTGAIDYTRQRDWYDPTKSNDRVTLVGCGGIGSPTALSLAKLGVPTLRLIDPDVVDAHNLPNQMFPLDAIGQPKVEVLAHVIAQFSPVHVRTDQCRVDANGMTPAGEVNLRPLRLNGVVVGALDSMAARSTLWQHVKGNPNVSLYVDGRLGGESVVVYCADPNDRESIARYEDTLHSDAEAVSNVCTRQSIIDVSLVVASLITRMVRRHLVGETLEHTLFWNQARLNATVGVAA